MTTYVTTLLDVLGLLLLAGAVVLALWGLYPPAGLLAGSLVLFLGSAVATTLASDPTRKRASR